MTCGIDRDGLKGLRVRIEDSQQRPVATLRPLENLDVSLSALNVEQTLPVNCYKRWARADRESVVWLSGGQTIDERKCEDPIERTIRYVEVTWRGANRRIMAD